MKTNSFSSRAVFTYAFFGFFSVFILSCGGYQNVAYADRDGIYGSGDEPRQQAAPIFPESNNYKNYFGSLQENTSTPETFTNVEQYSSVSDSISSTAYSTPTTEYAQSNPAWENSATSINYNFYNTNWGMSNYWYNSYWNNPYYYWGFDYWYSPLYIGWGYSPYYTYFGGYYPYNYYYYNPYAPNWYYSNNYYHDGRRFNTGRYTTPYYYGQNYPNRSNYNPRGGSPTNPRSPVRNNPNYNPNPRNNVTNPRSGVRTEGSGTRVYESPRFNNSNPRTNANGTRDYEAPRNNGTNSNSGTRTESNTPRYYNSGSTNPRSQSTPIRVNESNNTPTRSYTPAPSNPGNYNSGSYSSPSSGGGRSSAGGRR